MTCFCLHGNYYTIERKRKGKSIAWMQRDEDRKKDPPSKVMEIRRNSSTGGRGRGHDRERGPRGERGSERGNDRGISMSSEVLPEQLSQCPVADSRFCRSDTAEVIATQKQQTPDDFYSLSSQGSKEDLPTLQDCQVYES